MKSFIPYVAIIILAFSDKAWPQGTNFFPDTPDFEINFTGPQQPGSFALPFGVAELTNNVFSIDVNIGSVAASQASILQMESDGSLTPVFEITNQVNLIPVIPPITVPYYAAAQSWQVTDDQANSISAGNWYVQFTFSTGTDIGAIVPVPEPSSFDLLLFGAGFILYIYTRKCFGLTHQPGKSLQPTRVPVTGQRWPGLLQLSILRKHPR